MQKLYKATDTTTLALCCKPAEDQQEEQGSVVVLEWMAPGAAMLSALLQPVLTAAVPVRPASITSTVPARVYLELRATNTALSAGWCTTATLVAPSARLRARL